MVKPFLLLQMFQVSQKFERRQNLFFEAVSQKCFNILPFSGKFLVNSISLLKCYAHKCQALAQ